MKDFDMEFRFLKNRYFTGTNQLFFENILAFTYGLTKMQAHNLFLKYQK